MNIYIYILIYIDLIFSIYTYKIINIYIYTQVAEFMCSSTCVFVFFLRPWVFLGFIIQPGVSELDSRSESMNMADVDP